MRTMQMRAQSIRASDDGSVTIEGLAVPYGEPTEYAGQRESFAPDAFDTGQVINTPLLWSHQRDEPIGHITVANNTPDGLAITAVVQPTARGKDAAVLLRSGSLHGLSVGFEPLEWGESDDGWVYRRAKLHELSLTPMPAYEGAAVTATRQQEEPMTTATVAEVVDLAPITDRLDQIEARMTAPVTTEPVRHLSVREAFALQLADSKDTRHIRELADVLSSGNAGVLPPQWSSEVRDAFDATRYLIPRLGNVAFPSVGYTLTVPKVINQTQVSARGTEKTQVPSAALTTDSNTYTAAWYAGAVDIALELVWQSDPAILGLVVDSLLKQYAAVTDLAAYTALNTAATATGAALSFATYGAFVAAIMDQAEAIRVATGTPGDLVQLKTASWKALMSLVDSQGRRILATVGATNADGSAGLTSSSVDVGGITVFHNPRAAQDLQFNAVAARIAEKPPVQVSDDNTALMGRDVGILGAIMFLPLYPAGIKRHAATELATAAASKK